MRLVIPILLYKMIHCIKYIRIFLLYTRMRSPNYKFIKEQKTFFTFLFHDWASRRIAVEGLIIQWLYTTGEVPTWSPWFPTEETEELCWMPLLECFGAILDLWSVDLQMNSSIWYDLLLRVEMYMRKKIPGWLPDKPCWVRFKWEGDRVQFNNTIQYVGFISIHNFVSDTMCYIRAYDCK